MTMRYDYLKETPRWMIVLLVVVGLFAILPIANLIVVGYQNLKVGFSSALNLSELGQLGDFFGGQPISLDYSLASAAGDWKVFDVAIAGVSLVTNYRNSFASEVGKGGIDGLIKTLQEKNRRSATATLSPRLERPAWSAA